ncbi:MAG: prolyl oligopeptidase family serine peptidase [Candidatus Omnitrophica bacterium]|nr:prolyl oligopeptidase family serine peptidase [Candidatus Omnitrophota bacterium]
MKILKVIFIIIILSVNFTQHIIAQEEFGIKREQLRNFWKKRQAQTTMAQDSLETGKLFMNLQLNVDGLQRQYDLYIAQGINDTPRPVVFLLHGHNGNAGQLFGKTGYKSPYKLWLSIADREKLILIIPNGVVGSDGKRGWNDARNIESNDDIGFLKHLIEVTAKSYPVDRKRIYAMGTSNGGHMALQLASDASETFCAVAAIAASNPYPNFEKKPSMPVSVLLMNGTKDKLCPYSGGKMAGNRGEVLSTEESIRYWVEQNNCDSNFLIKEFPDKTKIDGSTVVCKTYRNNKTNTDVVLYEIRGGGHTEPSIKEHYSKLFLALVGNQNNDIEAADEIWGFFKSKNNRGALSYGDPK